VVLIDFGSGESPDLQRQARHASDKVGDLEEPGRMIIGLPHSASLERIVGGAEMSFAT
jgi:hypothetical protein